MENIEKVLELLDASLMTDLMEAREGEGTVPCYGIGFPPELEAGLRGATVTPFFDSKQDLDKFCAQYMSRFEEMAATNQTWFINDEGEDIGRYPHPQNPLV